MQHPRYLTKSRFKLALECPTKLHYTRKPQYVDNKQENDFLEALAEGGFQVGALAQCIYPQGVEVYEMDHAQALEATNEALSRDNVVLFEAAVQWGHCFVRVDILEKQGDVLRLLEVKSIGFDNDDDWFTNKDTIKKKIEPYLYDVAFQAFVLQQAFPHSLVQPYLVMLDKNTVTTVEGLQQKFRIAEEHGRTKVIVNDAIPLGEPILVEHDVAEYCKWIIDGTETLAGVEVPFADFVQKLGEAYASDTKVEEGLGKKCRDCEFQCFPEPCQGGKLSGFRECWRSMAGFNDADFDKPLTIGVWDNRRADRHVAAGKYFQEQLEYDDLAGKNSKDKGSPGLSRVERQLLQVNYAKSLEEAPYYFDVEGFRAAMATFRYPLHFIDFETVRPAIPLHKGVRPYAQLAFQFSHHIYYADGRYAHCDEYLDTRPGVFPNFEFVRMLKRSLEADGGTIFRYAAHENSVLVDLYHELSGSEEPDRQALMDWIRSMTISKGKDAPEHWEGARNMVDMFELVKRYFYHPDMGGSNSIKDVLPAVLNASKALQDKYAQPVYGTEQIPSQNYRDMVWIHHDEEGRVVNPYKLLPSIDHGSREVLDRLYDKEHISEGGAAMIAWSRTQYTEMGDEEREEITRALLKYCELDTLAMVLIWEFWMGELGRASTATPGP